MISTIKDRHGTNYLGEFVGEDVLRPYLDKMKKFVGQKKYTDLTGNQIQRDRGHHHITVISVIDVNELSKRGISFEDIKEKADKIIGSSSYTINGLGRAFKNNSEAYFVAIDWPEADRLRRELGLNKQYFHVTLGFNPKDVFGVPKISNLKEEGFIKI